MNLRLITSLRDLLGYCSHTLSRLHLVLAPWAPCRAGCMGPGGYAVPRQAVATFLGRLHACPVQLSSRPGHDRLLKLPPPPLRGLPAVFGPWLTLLARARAELTESIGRAGAGKATGDWPGAQRYLAKAMS